MENRPPELELLERLCQSFLRGGAFPKGVVWDHEVKSQCCSFGNAYLVALEVGSRIDEPSYCVC